MRRFARISRWGFALALVVSLSAMLADRAAARDSRPGHHIYCIRGAFNVFSLGMDEICDKLTKMGLSASVHNHTFWSSLASEAAENYKSGSKRTIILMGHSAGASAVANITEQLGAAGVPVKLAIELDCLWTTTASGRVDKFINLYVGSGSGKPVVKGPQFKGTLQNIDVSKNVNTGHFSIDKDPAIQARVIQYVRQALARPAPQQTPAAPATATSSPAPADTTTGSTPPKPAGST